MTLDWGEFVKMVVKKNLKDASAAWIERERKRLLEEIGRTNMLSYGSGPVSTHEWADDDLIKDYYNDCISTDIVPHGRSYQFEVGVGVN